MISDWLIVFRFRRGVVDDVPRLQRWSAGKLLILSHSLLLHKMCRTGRSGESVGAALLCWVNNSYFHDSGEWPDHSLSVHKTYFILQIYASLWKATSAVPGIGETLWVGSFFFLSASLTVFAFLLSMMAWWKLKGRDINDLGKKTDASFKKKIDSNIWYPPLLIFSVRMLLFKT